MIIRYDLPASNFLVAEAMVESMIDQKSLSKNQRNRENRYQILELHKQGRELSINFTILENFHRK